MKKTLRYIVVAALALCLTQAAALAAAPVTVQLDGQTVTFTDAQPQIRSERTFLPFRAVFEAMGAKVDNSGDTVTATRGDTTIAMTIGSTKASVTKNGVTTELTMDVAPYVDSATWRTYVPVRFAAQALGANVGWDGAANTVVIVDTEKRVDEALAGKSFTYLEKLAAYSEKYSTGVWTSELAMNGSVSVDFGTAETPLAVSVPVTLTAKGVAADGVKMDVTEKATVDLSTLSSLLAASFTEQLGEEAAAATADKLVEALKENGAACTLRGDLSTGKLYVNVDLASLGDMAEQLAGLSFDKNTWYVMDLNALAAASDIDFAELMKQSKNIDCKALIAELASEADVNDAAKGYDTFNATLKALVNALADDGFVKNGNVYTTSVEQEIEGMMLKLKLAVTMKNDAVAAYGIDMAMTGDVEEAGKLSLTMKLDVNEQDKVSGTMTMDIGGMVKASFDISGGYVKGGSAPTVNPPAGAKIVDLMEAAGELSSELAK